MKKVLFLHGFFASGNCVLAKALRDGMVIFADEKFYIVTEKVYYMIMRRDRYLKQVISKKNGMIKIVTGIRRCGKSYTHRIQRPW